MLKEQIAKLLRFESSTLPAGTKTSLSDYVSRLQNNQRDIYYLVAPSRVLAESSPYYEALKKKDVEVLFCFEPYDELNLMMLRQFDKYNLMSVEKEMRNDEEVENLEGKTFCLWLCNKISNNCCCCVAGDVIKGEMDTLKTWLKTTLSGKVHAVKTTQRLDSHPCVVTVEEMGAARHFIRTQSHNMPEESRYTLLQPQLEINPK